MTSPKEVADAVQGAGEIAKVAAKVYDDLASPLARQIGRTGGALAEAILTGPTELFLTATQAQRWLGAYVRARMDRKGFNADRIVPPDPQIYVGAVAGIMISGHVDELREMFGNLLMYAMDAAVPEMAHPSFAEIVRQLSPLEARIIKHLRADGSVAAVWFQGHHQQLQAEYAAGGPFALFEEEEASLPYTSHAFQNLARLGLVSLETDRRLKESVAYRELEAHEFIAEALSRQRSDFGRLHLLRGLAEITDFGTRFGTVVLDDDGPCPPPALTIDNEK